MTTRILAAAAVAVVLWLRAPEVAQRPAGPQLARAPEAAPLPAEPPSIRASRDLAGPEDCICVTGSIFVVGEALEALGAEVC